MTRPEYTCTQCGKTFINHVPSEWLYKKKIRNHTLWFCSYSCKSQYEEAHPVRKHTSMK